ncbi:MAG: glycosyltransferase family 4 protein, partial [Campylobacterales bacterium]|nr:glycosyltransferase family 4 protein [Campylobacterales bacterium]
MKIAFLIGSPDISGGSFVIFEHALRLVAYGHNVAMITEIPLKRDKRELHWHKKAQTLEWLSFDQVEKRQISFDITIATWWRTFYELYRVKSSQYAYFVQSIESKFYDSIEKPLCKLVESTYVLDIPIITEATWIKKYLYDNYHKNAWLVKNGIRKDVYNLIGDVIEPRNPNKLRVLVEGPLHVGFKNVPKTIELCKKSNADEIWLLTSTKIDKVDGIDRVFSRVPVEKTAEIYRSCDVIVKLSYVEGMFGPPLEMFHCGGTAIVYNVTGHDEYIVHDVNGLVVKTDDDEQVIKYINELKKNPEKLDLLKKNAIETADNWHGWDESAKIFENSLIEIMNAEHYGQNVLKLKSQFMFDWYV